MVQKNILDDVRLIETKKNTGDLELDTDEEYCRLFQHGDDLTYIHFLHLP